MATLMSGKRRLYLVAMIVVMSAAFVSPARSLASEVDSTSPATELFLGSRAMDKSDWDSAQTHLRAELQLEQSNNQAHLLLAITLDHLGDRAEAEWEFRTAVRGNPASYGIAYLAAAFLEKIGKQDDAAELYATAIGLRPTFLRGLIALGNLEVLRGNSELALALLNRGAAIAQAAGNPVWEIYDDMSVAVLRSSLPRRENQALDFAERASASAPAQPEPHFLAAKALLALGQANQAAAHLREAIRLDSSNPAYHALLARALFRDGQRELGEREVEASHSPTDLATAR